MKMLSSEVKGILDKLYNLRGEDSVILAKMNKERQDAIDRLASDSREDYLDYILTIDIFNEGVDIPEINQVIMLRPTQSPIVFVQQLGRGLRKKEGKDYATSTNTDIYRYNIAADMTTNLTEGMMGYDLNISVAPTGNKLAWESMERDG